MRLIMIMNMEMEVKVLFSIKRTLRNINVVLLFFLAFVVIMV